MIVNSTELQNNFGKYLQLVAHEEIIITRNGTAIAKLTALQESDKHYDHGADVVFEKAESYAGRKAAYEQFLELSKNSEERYEYIDGEIHWLASPKIAHQKAAGELFGTLFNWFQGKDCVPLMAPCDIELQRSEEDINIVQPDLMVICDLEEKLDENGYYKGIPALVVEILSASTRSKDLIKKLDLYMSTDIKEYWIVNPMNREVTVYQFEEREITASTTYKNNETAQSYIFEGLSAKLTDIFK
jgi:prevent-host-death family protein